MKATSKGKSQKSLRERHKDHIARAVREELAKPARRVGRLPSQKQAPKLHVAASGPAARTGAKAKTKAKVRTKARPGVHAAGYHAGNGHGNGHAGMARGFSQPGATEVPARYGQAYYGQAHYVTDPAPTPVPGKAKVKLELKTRTDANLVGFGHSHDEAIAEESARFPTPQPTALVFGAALAALESKLAELENHRVAGKNLTEQRDVLRAEFEQIFTQRGNYVELISDGDADWIASTGLPVRNGPTPVGILPSPLALRVDLTSNEGEMVIRWDPVTGAKSYMLEVADVVDNVAVGWRLLYMGGKFSTLQTGMVVGKTYAFRVAAVGGEGGKSPFSPEVWRAAA